MTHHVASGTRRLRRGRHSIVGQVYLLTSATHDRHPWFNDFFNGRAVVRAFRYQHAKEHVDSLACVVMPDHFHWLVQLTGVVTLAALMANVKAYSASCVLGKQTKNEMVRRVWQRGYHDHALRKEEDICAIARYIVANPIRAGLVRRVGDYPLWDAVWI